MSNGIECLCGRSIPREGTDFQPTCRHCERIHLNRSLQQIET